jgi:hypothetical protein
MKPEKRNLIHDLLDEEHDMRREAILVAGGRILRHRRWKRTAMRSAAALAVVAIVAAISIQEFRARQLPVIVKISAPAAVRVHYLTDDELLNLFTNTPVGLATVGGKKILIFPRPGDEEHFITRL